MTEAVLLPEAKEDLEEAYLWYEEQSPGLGMDFLGCIEALLASIQRTPQIYPVVHKTYRRALVRRFPFAVFFEHDNATDPCIVYSVFHCAQNPDKWHKRIQPNAES